MEKLEYKAQIAASRQKVWDTMLGPDTYKKWANPDQYPDSTYEGSWTKGEDIKFISPGQGGTMANIAELIPNEYVLANHVAVINADGSVDRDASKHGGWIGTKESYKLAEKDGQTELTVTIETPPGWVKMFNDWWPPALVKLKALCEG